MPINFRTDPYNIHIAQGADYNASFQLTAQDTSAPIDITGYTWKGQLRTFYTSQSYTNFNILPLAPFNQGVIAINLTALQTAALSAPTYFYDIFGTDTFNITTRFLFGVIHIDFRVTR